MKQWFSSLEAVKWKEFIVRNECDQHVERDYCWNSSLSWVLRWVPGVMAACLWCLILDCFFHSPFSSTQIKLTKQVFPRFFIFSVPYLCAAALTFILSAEGAIVSLGVLHCPLGRSDTVTGLWSLGWLGPAPLWPRMKCFLTFTFGCSSMCHYIVLLCRATKWLRECVQIDQASPRPLKGPPVDDDAWAPQIVEIPENQQGLTWTSSTNTKNQKKSQRANWIPGSY